VQSSAGDHAHAVEGCMLVELLIKFALKVIVELTPLILGFEVRLYQNRRDRNTYAEVGQSRAAVVVSLGTCFRYPRPCPCRGRVL
jgi:hypothetical protein